MAALMWQHGRHQVLADDRNEVPTPPHLDLENGEAFLGVVVGHPLAGALRRPSGSGLRFQAGNNTRFFPPCGSCPWIAGLFRLRRCEEG